MLDEQSLLMHELIGLHARVVESNVKQFVGIKGMIVDETKNMLVFEAGDKEKRVPKKACVFEFVLPDGKKAVVNGEKIAFAPEERPKKLWRSIGKEK
ncbi:ribonuclease P protein component 1 [Candidatus Micrarchaeota archaeon]|nr:ribonuclease P protein component 1 [Candidatus Micrarchaeota archaeon]